MRSFRFIKQFFSDIRSILSIGRGSMRTGLDMKKILFALWLLLSAFFSLTIRVCADGSLMVQIRYADAVPFTDTAGYTVNAYVSVLDSAGTPVKGLTSNGFRVYEDSSIRTVKDVKLSNDEPLSLVLLMDMSGSMLGQPLYDAGAAAGFLQKLGPYDRTAVMSFNETALTLSRFTTDHTAAANASLQAVPVNGKGSCLYDSICSAMEMLLSEGEGRRAIVLFTDGTDELADGSKCSVRSVSDVLNFSSQNHIPIFLMGIGSQTDSNELKRIGENSGGSFVRIDAGTDMKAAFTRIYDQIVNDYKVIYESNGVTGPHTIMIAAERNGIPGQGSYTLSFPAMPTIMRFQSPAENTELRQTALLSVAFISQSAEIGSVEYYGNGKYIGKTVSYPYDLSWDISEMEPGAVTIEAVAYGKDGKELARRSMIAAIGAILPTAEPTAAPDPTETPVPTPVPTVPPEPKSGNGMKILIPAIFAALIAIAGMLLIRRGGTNKKPIAGPYEEGPSGPTANELFPDSGKQQTGSILAILEVRNSDDRAFIGSRFYVTKLPFTMGRSTDNDVVLPQKDTAVGRHHAILEEHGGQITIRDLNSKYGTFINDRKLSEFPIPLENGALIRLGSRLLLRCTKTGNSISGSGEEATVDRLKLIGSRLDQIDPPAEPPSERPLDDTVRTDKVHSKTGDETVRINLIGGRSDRHFGNGK